MKLDPRQEKALGRAAFLLLLLITAFAIWRTEGRKSPRLQAFSHQPAGIMGTSCRLLAVVEFGAGDKGRRALCAAEEALRAVEAAMSAHLGASQISRLNQARQGESIALSPAIMTVLRASADYYKRTGGAFDITCRPLITLWKKCGRRGRLPTPAEITAARQESTWTQLVIQEGRVRKKAKGLQVDLGGIAKGFGIDRAVGALISADCKGGLVEVGGDLRVFGTPPTGKPWRVEIRNPFGKGTCATLEIKEGAACTSGNYFRFTTIAGKRYSHIIDPRNGWPADAAPAVTVVAPTATAADAWATALSVLGPAGLERLQKDPGAAAFLITGTPDNHQRHLTPHFPTLLPAAIAPDFGEVDNNQPR